MKSVPTVSETGAKLRALFGGGRPFLLPGAMNALAARIIEDIGFEAVYVTGAGVSNSSIGVPDYGLLTLSELSDHVMRMSEVVSLPIVVDADTGFGNAINVTRTVRLLERSGAQAIQLEDQTFPKRCGHFDDKSVIPTDDMIQKLQAALDARRDEDLLIIARTDARSTEGMDAAIERAARYVEVGADVVFVEGPEDAEEIRRVGREVPGPKIINMVIGGKTPLMSFDELGELGFSAVLYANAALQASIQAMQNVLGHLYRQGSIDGVEGSIATFEERQRLVAKPDFDELQRRYKTTEQ